MKKSFSVGDRVTLSDSMCRACNDDERYSFGIVTRIGYWDIVDVRFCGLTQDVGMRTDELKPC